VQGLREYLQLLRVYERLSLIASSVGKGVVIVTPAGNDSTAVARAPVSSPLQSRKASYPWVRSGGLMKAIRCLPIRTPSPRSAPPGTDIQSAFLRAGITSMSGTSMVCANASGVAAQWWEYLRARKGGSRVTSRMVVDEMVKAARSTAFIAAITDIERGAGLIQVRAAGAAWMCGAQRSAVTGRTPASGRITKLWSCREH
jgi:hypothetical protein